MYSAISYKGVSLRRVGRVNGLELADEYCGELSRLSTGVLCTTILLPGGGGGGGGGQFYFCLSGCVSMKSKEMGPFDTQVNEMNGTILIRNGY